MQTAIGKTISRIEEHPTDPKYLYARGDTLLVHFTDGTALEVSGHSYEDVSLDYCDRDRTEVASRARAAQGRREKERLTRLSREAWNALTDEQRAEKTAARRAKMSPFELAMEDTMKGMARSMIADANRSIFGTDLVIPVADKKPKARRS